MNCVYTYGSGILSYCNQQEYENIKSSGVDVSALLCAKYPYHKEIVGYSKNCPKNHFEYLYAFRPDKHIMALNMVDAKDKKYFSDEIILAGIDFIQNELEQERNVVAVCNKGQSRSPTMCLLYMMAHGDFDINMSHSEVFCKFSEIAKLWNPNNGILEYCVDFWNKIKGGAYKCEDIQIKTEVL